eukprot:scaffold164639_cov48-Attheya_sp.AAC.3
MEGQADVAGSMKLLLVLLLKSSLYSGKLAGWVTSSTERVGMFCTCGKQFFNPSTLGYLGLFGDGSGAECFY